MFKTIIERVKAKLLWITPCMAVAIILLIIGSFIFSKYYKNAGYFSVTVLLISSGIIFYYADIINRCREAEDLTNYILFSVFFTPFIFVVAALCFVIFFSNSNAFFISLILTLIMCVTGAIIAVPIRDRKAAVFTDSESSDISPITTTIDIANFDSTSLLIADLRNYNSHLADEYEQKYNNLMLLIRENQAVGSSDFNSISPALSSEIEALLYKFESGIHKHLEAYQQSDLVFSDADVLIEHTTSILTDSDPFDLRSHIEDVHALVLLPAADAKKKAPKSNKNKKKKNPSKKKTKKKNSNNIEK